MKFDPPDQNLAAEPEPLQLRNPNQAFGSSRLVQPPGSEIQYRRLFETAKDGLLIIDATTGTILEVNSSLSNMLGCSPENLIGNRFWDIALFQDIVPNEASFAELRQSEHVLLQDKTIDTVGGKRIDVEFICTVSFVHDRRLIQCNIRDITTRKRMKSAERNRIERMERQLEAVSRVSVSDAILNGDVERLARQITEEAARATGVERANVWLFNESETELRCIDLYESSKGHHSAGMVLRQSSFENEFRALKNTSHVAADDPLTDPRTAGYVEGYLKPLGITSMLDTVIEVSHKHVGLLCLEHVGRPHVWEADEIAFAGRLADKIPVTIANHGKKQREEHIKALARFPSQNPNAILRVSGEGRVLYANPASKASSGLFDAAIGGAAHRDIVANVRECLADNHMRKVEIESSNRVFLITFVPFQKAGYANAYAIDITERKRAEASLRDSHALLAATERIAGVGGFKWDLGRDMLVWSDGLYRIFGREPGSYRPSIAAFLDSVHPDDRRHMEDVIAADLAGNAPAEVEYRIFRPDGSVRVIVSRSEIQRDADGKPVQITGTSQDITERKHADDALRESRELIEGIINAIPVRVFWKDKNLIYLGCNSIFARDAGFTEPKEIIGKDDYQMGWRDQAEFYRSDDRQVIVSGMPKGPLEEPQTTPDGNTITLLTSKVPLRDSEGEIRGVLGTYIDITERKRAEEAMARAISALKTLSSCSAALVRIKNEESLLNEICRILVTMSGYPLVWVGFAEDDLEKTVRPVAHAGYRDGDTEQTDLSWDEAAPQQGPVGRAIYTCEPQLVRDAQTDAGYAPWRNSTIKIGYRTVLCLPLRTSGLAFGVLCLYATDADAFDDEEIRLLSGLANEVAFGIVNLRARTEQEKSEERLQRSMESTIAALAGTLELRDAYTAGHQRRVAELAAAIATEMGFSEDQIHGLHLAALVHDLGKIQIPADLLTKPTKLTNLEYELVKTHAQAGYELLKNIDFPWPIAELVYQHHERLDGTGYPRGLRGNEILIGAKILSVADTIEAMSSHRPYRPGLGIETSLAEISTNRGKAYDAEAVDACLRLFHEKGFRFSA